MITDLDRILLCAHHDPFGYLGAHFSEAADLVTLRTFQPHAASVATRIAGHDHPMRQFHQDGIFVLELPLATLPEPRLSPFSYQYVITFADGRQILRNDPYRFSPLLGEQDRYLYNAGRNYKIYNHLGAIPCVADSIAGFVFRVWAPNAAAISVIGSFNSWDPRPHQMRSLGASGIWELFIPQLEPGELYKFRIRTQSGDLLEKSDPFQFYGELRPNTASVTARLDGYQWNDENWLEKTRQDTPYQRPLAIYEVHPGSWRRDPADPDRFLTYRELADQLVPYVVEMGFTHIELMPVMEHPLDESWGYQVTGPYSITSRYGTPEEFMYFVDTCHQQNIGVILDWVPAHFPKDGHSLGRFDGTALYEHEDSRKGAHPEWGTFIYNYGRNEVSNYLIANALFWMDKYHIDGLRVDAVASMLYLDYSRKDGEWLPNRHGGRENLEAIDFLRHLNATVYQEFPGSMMIAEESTSFYGVSKPTDQNGLGFGFKWNMGWMNDILQYFGKDPLYRKHHHDNLTFSIMYAFSENFILPLSHDEVVHGKRSLLDKMPGDLWQKFANLRLLLLYMWLHPGKKLLFMGAEIGMWNEWYCKQSLDWHLLKQGNLHEQLQTYVKNLNSLYTKNPSLWELDFSEKGFQWLDLADRDNSIISFSRYGKTKEDHLVTLLNFTPQTVRNYPLGLAQDRRYRVIFSSDNKTFGGSAAGEDIPEYIAVPIPHGQAGYSTRITVPPLAGVVLKPV